MASTQLAATVLDDHVTRGSSSPKPNLASLPSTFVLASHLSESELHEVEDLLVERGAPLTYDIKEANLVIGNISKEKRAKFELKRGKVPLDECEDRLKPATPDSSNQISAQTKPPKRQKLNNGIEGQPDVVPNSQLSEATLKSVEVELVVPRIKVVKLDWLRETLAQRKIQPFEPYTVYEACLVPHQDIETPPALDGHQTPVKSDKATRVTSETRGFLPQDVLERAKADIKPSLKPFLSRGRNRDYVKEATSRDFTGRTFMTTTKAASQKSLGIIKHPPRLLHQTTSEHDADFEGSSRPMPDWVKEHKIYSCERVTPLQSPNDEFIAQLKKIKLARLLTGDEVGVRAYSTSIASLAAYPYPLLSLGEILALPGCDQKIAQLFNEWHTSGGHIEAVAEIDADPVLNVLNLFYEIWGVGASTAREFYYDRNWRDLDDIIEHGWKSLTRVQQIGVKYYDEFHLKMSRSQVEAVAATIQSHARRLTDDRLEAIIVGGYRRGKLESGDADIILTHPSEPMTRNLISSVVASLEATGCITHTLTLALTNSHRDQQPLPVRTSSAAGHGFDTLDKALVVWQDQSWPSRAADLAADPNAKNPNPHRRVDIIISPWRTIGCAVEGWTSGTTFQRDLRRYAKKIKGWKFDSSGVRDRGSGRWIDLEGWADPATRCTDWRVAEKKVFEGMGLVYREPWERCTG